MLDVLKSRWLGGKSEIGANGAAMRGLSNDIRYALRTLRHGGVSTMVAVLSLAIGVGARAGERPVLQQRVLEGDPELSL